MSDPREQRLCEAYLAVCLLLLGALLVGCRKMMTDTNTPSCSTETSTPTTTQAPEASEAIVQSTLAIPTTLTELLPIPVSGVPSPTPDAVRQLTSMRAGEPWWSEDGRTLYFPTMGPDAQNWSFDLATNTQQPRPDVQGPYRRAMSLVDSFIPTKVPLYSVSVSPSGSRVIFARPVTPTASSEEICDGEACWLLPSNEIWLIDVESERLTRLQVEGELTAEEVSYLWSGNENRVVVRVPPSWMTGSDTPTVWIADLPSERVYPMGNRDDRVLALSISPNGDLVIYQIKESGLDAECDTYLWSVNTQEEKLLPGLPCTKHFWLSDNRTVVFIERAAHRIVFWAYDVTTAEQREIASSKTLPYRSYETYWHAVAPDERSVALVPFDYDHTSLGIWLVELDLSDDDQ